jgi:gliding motility-associated-like protein
MDWQKATNFPKLEGTASAKISCYGSIFLHEKMSNTFLGQLEFIFGDYPQASNFYGNEFRGSVNYSYEPKNTLVQKIEKNLKTTTLAVTVTVSVTDESCAGNCDGNAKVNVAGSAGPFTYSYFPSGPYSGEPGDSIYNLCAGGKTVVVKDLSTGLNHVRPFTISNNPIIVIHNFTTDNTCFQSCDGEINMSSFGGVGTLHYLWTGGQTTESAVNLCAGYYTLTISDDAGCTELYTDTVEEPTLLTGSITSQTNLLCNNVCIGAATVTASGGTAGYSYSWYDAGGGITNSVNSLCAGTYHLKITDANGCLDTVPVIITEPSAISLSANTTQNLLCAGVCNGEVTRTGSGGTAPLVYSWYDAPGTPSSAVVSNLCAGTYHVAVVDGNGCKDTAVTSVTTPTALSSSIVDSNDVLCRGLCTGDATVRATGGTAPYTYYWYNLVGMTDTLATGICAGATNVQVTDANGCKDTSTVDQTNNICSYYCNGDATVRVSGGTTPYTYNWYDAPGLETDTVANNLCTQDYHVEIVDGNGCTDTVSVSILSPAALVGSIIDSIPLNCTGACTGSLTADGSGGTGAYSFNWLTPASPGTNIVSNLCAGTYEVEIADANGCLDTITYDLLVPPGVNAIITSQTNNDCFGSCNGAATASSTGGTLPISYSWYDAAGQTTASVNGLCNGTYHVAVLDGTGCKDTTTVTITSPAELVGSSTDTTVTCLGLCNGKSKLTATGGTPGYKYVWPNGNWVTSYRNNLCAGTHLAVITDFKGCKDSIYVVLTAPTVVVTAVNNIDSTSCAGVCDGSANIYASGGSSPYAYNWTTAGNQSDSTGINLCAGSHSVTVTDANGCVDITTVDIFAPAALVAVITDSNNISCNGLSDGDATAGASGGTAPYTYLWTDVAGNPTTAFVNNLTAGIYHVVVTDANGCFDTVSVNITEPAALNATISTVAVSCNGLCDGSMNASVTTGGTAPYSYNWYEAGNQTSPNISGLCISTHHVEVTDARGCIDTAVATITQPAVLVASIIDSNEATCAGICNGDATASAAGGTAPYQYNWYNAGNQNTALATGLCFGTNEVEVTDNNGCVDTVQVQITAPVVVIASMTDSVPVSCFGYCDGSATVDATGGTLPYSYDWFTAGNQTDSIATNICAGINQVIVTDANGCLDTVSVFIDSPTQIVATSTITTPTCNGSCDGTMSVAVVGGVPGYTHKWSTGSTISALINLCAGSYTDTITDATGCFDTTTFVVAQPTAVQANASAQRMSCFGIADGQVSSNPTGGTSPYTYQWDDISLSTTSSVSNLSQGLYTVIVSDSLNCKDTASVTVVEPSKLTLNISDTNYAACFCNGSATVSGTGGTVPYTYAWNDLMSQSTAQATNLCAGNYQVIVTDSSLCADTISIAILDTSSTFIAQIVDSNAVSCFSICDGDATVRAINGTAPFTYSWNDPLAQSDTTAVNLCAGNYIATVTDGNGCVRVAHATVNTPPSIVGTVSIVTPLCNGDCNGIATVAVSGGDGGPYTHSWSNLSSNDSIINICAGTYYDTISDGSGCSSIVTVVVGEPAVLTTNLSKTDITCFGLSNGIINSNVNGGTTPYSYLWDDIAASITPSISALDSGKYKVLVTDANGCVAIDSATIAEPSLLTTYISDSNNVNCNCVGFANLSTNGGTLPYTFSWNDPLAQTDSTAINLCAGIYTGTVTDARGCLASAMVSIMDTSGFSASINNIQNLICNGACIGSANISAKGGLAPYIFTWNDPANQTDSTAINLCGGNYIGTAIDGLGCRFVLPVTIIEPATIQINPVVHDATCFGYCDGYIETSVTGGWGKYTYTWNDSRSQTTPIADSLCLGSSYTVLVTDSLGCTASSSHNISSPTKLFALIGSYNDINCTNTCTGSIGAVGVGGIAPYTYLWSNSSTNQIATGLCADTFMVKIIDANNCVDSTSQILVEPLLALSSIITASSDSLLCNNVCDGWATVKASGGTPGYNYNWYNAGNLNDTTGVNLCAGLNSVEITDSKGCRDTASVNILAPPAIIISITNQQNVSCNGNCDGAIRINVSGGKSPYSIQWNDPSNSTDTMVANLCAGVYTVSVSDSNGCVETLQITITEPTAMSAIVTNQTNVICQSYCDGSATVQANGGVGPYTYLWPTAGNQTDSTAINLCAQTYSYQITDSVGCVFTDSLTIINTGMNATVSQVNVTCFGLCDGSASISTSGGLAPYTHSWTTGSTSNSISNVCAGLYQDTIRDGSGCVSVVDVNILEPAKLVASFDITNISCHGLNDGKLVGQASGGTAPYKYWYWVGNWPVQTRTNLSAGFYQIEIKDANGCKDTADANIIDPPVLTLNLASQVAASCAGLCDAQATVLANGGTPGYTYNWSKGQTGASVNNLCAGKDTVVVSDTNNCTAQIEVTSTEPPAIQISFTDTVQILCSTICNGEVRAVASGGTGAFSYQWNDPALTAADFANNLCPGTYQVVVQDARGCIDSASYDINTLVALSININSNNPKCFGDCNGDVTAVPLGGVKPYQSVLWGGPGNAAGKTTLKVSNLCQGTYFVTVTDANGCQASSSKQLTNPPLLVPSITDSSHLSCFGICDGDATVTPVGGTPPFTYTWNDPSAQTTSQALNLCAGEWKVIVVDANGCTQTDSVTLTQPSKLVSNNTTTPAQCTNTPDGAIAETASGGTGKLNYSWSGPGGYSSILEDPSNILPGRYILTLNDSNNCTLIDTADVAALTYINAFAGNDTAICNTKPITIYGSGGLTYLWSSGQTDSTITVSPSSTTTYTLYVSSGACKDTADITVTVNAQPIAAITMDKSIVLENTSTTLHGTGAGVGGTYDWTPPTSLNDPTVQDPIATPSKTTTYLLTVTTAAGCWDTATATLKTAKDITFPNGITPNGDGRNDTWVIDLIEQFPQCQVEIFNRWGQLLFQSPGYVQQWDGTFDGKPLPVGTYYYIIDLGPGLKKYTGPITLMR